MATVDTPLSGTQAPQSGFVFGLGTAMSALIGALSAFVVMIVVGVTLGLVTGAFAAPPAGAAALGGLVA
ncbi:MAG: hypothetical protein AAGH60_12980, partial [Pseudomonadota bacterium]